MKFSLFTTLFCSIFLIACSNTKPLVNELSDDAADKIPAKNLTSGQVSVALYSKDKQDTLASSIDYAYYTQPKLAYHDSVNEKVKLFIYGCLSLSGFDVDRSVELSPEIMKQGLESFASMYNEEMSLFDNDEYNGGIWSKEVSNAISEKKEYVELNMDHWEYSGGAHGSVMSTTILIDKITGQLLTLEDFFTDVAEITALAEVIFRSNHELGAEEDLVDAGFWFENGEFNLNDNFTFTDNSLDFLFNQYEIAPYSAGLITISIPMDQIKHLLKRKVN